MSDVRRGDVWLAELDKPRPCVVVTRQSTLDSPRTRVTVAPVSTTIRNIPSQIIVDERNGLSERSAVNAAELNTISMADLIEHRGRLAKPQIGELNAALRFALGLDA